MAYDDGNIFAKILRGEIPSHRVYEDDAIVSVAYSEPAADLLPASGRQVRAGA